MSEAPEGKIFDSRRRGQYRDGCMSLSHTLNISAILFGAVVLCGCKLFEAKPGFPYPAAESLKIAEKSTTEGRRSFSIAGPVVGEIELIAFDDEAVAKAFIGAEQAGVRSAFGDKINPYVGQVTSLVECDARIAPKDYGVSFAGREATLVTGGANTRKVFGACTADELKYVGGFLAAYDREKRWVAVVRLFKPAPSLAEYPALQEEMPEMLDLIFRGR